MNLKKCLFATKQVDDILSFAVNQTRHFFKSNKNPVKHGNPASYNDHTIKSVLTNSQFIQENCLEFHPNHRSTKYSTK